MTATHTEAIATAATSGSEGPVKPKRSMKRYFAIDGWGALVLPLLLFLVVVFLVPLVAMLVKSFTDPEPGLDNYRAVFAEPLYMKVIFNTFYVATLVTLVTLLLAYPYAYLMTLVKPFWRTVMMVIMLIPFWTSVLVRSFALIVLMRDTGVMNTLLIDTGITDEPITMLRTFGGVVFGMVQVSLPFAVLPMYATMSGIDKRLSLAAQNLGARPSGAFWRVFVPLSVPGVAAGLLLTFIQALGYYITPALLGGPQNTMIGELIVQQVSAVLRYGFAAALATMLLLLTLALLGLASKFLNLEKALMRRS
ncbi:ABC transporter permease [Leucobacter tenebrionis]|uniref:ABC transporter permease n=1 Tax=Leucobacter tenebrionis TaxID=2873270 RepID=UPI001CA799B6|nr:ABC transporter permease [Leucobacter tenebrionis]QZY52672.1 ABC transporter permease [Leucobacter tenebrionis]